VSNNANPNADQIGSSGTRGETMNYKTMNFKMIAVLLSCALGLSSCIPVYTQPTINSARGSSSDVSDKAKSVSAFAIGEFTGLYGGEFREALVKQLEQEGFVITYAGARATNDKSNFVLSGSFEGITKENTVWNTDPFTGFRTRTVTVSQALSKGVLRVISRNDGQAVRIYSFDMSEPANQGFFRYTVLNDNINQLSGFLIQNIRLEFKPAIQPRG
jgi:hypothetical protein